MNTAAESIVTQRAAAPNKIFNRLRQNWMRGFVIKLNGRESGDGCELMDAVAAWDFERHDQTTGRIVA
jgi:hypothetical protein